MRLRALMLLCCVVALLSGLSLFTPLGRGNAGSWLDIMFIVAIAMTLILGLSMLTKVAAKSVETSLSSKVDPQANPQHDKRDQPSDA